VTAPALPPPSLPVWFARVCGGFIRRELLALGGYRAAFAVRLLGLATGVGALLFLARFVGAAENPHLARYGGNYLGFVVIGTLAATLQQVGIAGLAQRIRVAQMMGTLEAELATPAPPWMVLGAAPIYEFGSAALRATVYLLGATVILGMHLPRANWLSLALAVPPIIGAFVGLGLLAAGSTMLIRRTNPIAMVIGSLSFFLSGVVYPVSVLPAWLVTLGQLLPLTHALAALRGALLVGAGPGALAGPLLALVLFTVVLAPLGIGIFAYALRRARIDGSLSHY
jgi:ABC-2 type transport system permease protein